MPQELREKTETTQ